MFVHHVVFWLRDDCDEARRDALRRALVELKAIDTVRHLWVGSAVASDRPVVDSSFDVSLTVIFDHRQGHDDYQVHPLHEAFVANFKDAWERIRVYDAVD